MLIQLGALTQTLAWNVVSLLTHDLALDDLDHISEKTMTYRQTSRSFDQFLSIQGCKSFQRVSFILWLLFLESFSLLLLQLASHLASNPLELLSPFPMPTPQQTLLPLASFTFLRQYSPLFYLSMGTWTKEGKGQGGMWVWRCSFYAWIWQVTEKRYLK